MFFYFSLCFRECRSVTCSSGGAACCRPQTCSPYRKWRRMTSVTTPVSWFLEASWCGGRPIWAWQVVQCDVYSLCIYVWEHLLWYPVVFLKHEVLVFLLLLICFQLHSLCHAFVNSDFPACVVNAQVFQWITTFQSVPHKKLSYDFRRFKI